jgi:hypothetical protein
MNVLLQKVWISFFFSILLTQTVLLAVQVESEDTLVNNTNYDDMNPSMISTPDGDLWIAMDDCNTSRIAPASQGMIRLYNSSDGGKTWVQKKIFSKGQSSANPSITYADGRIFIAFEGNSEDTTNLSVEVAFYKISEGSFQIYTVENAISMALGKHIYPEIATDYIENYNHLASTYLYVTYTKSGPKYDKVYFSRSQDQAETWSTPVDLTGTALDSTIGVRPDIAFGQNSLYVTFEKLAQVGTETQTHVWVTRSSDFGNNWSTPLELSNSSGVQTHPRVVADHGGSRAIVAYTRDYHNNNDFGIYYSYSVDNGTHWTPGYLSIDPSVAEKDVELAVSNVSPGLFHAVYYVDGNLKYRNLDTKLQGSWSSELQVEHSGASVYPFFPKATVAVDPTRSVATEVCLAWTDDRQNDGDRDVYFNRSLDNNFLPSIYYLLQ